MYQNLKPWRVSGQLEQPEDPDDAEELEDVGVLSVLEEEKASEKQLY